MAQIQHYFSTFWGILHGCPSNLVAAVGLGKISIWRVFISVILAVFRQSKCFQRDQHNSSARPQERSPARALLCPLWQRFLPSFRLNWCLRLH